MYIRIAYLIIGMILMISCDKEITLDGEVVNLNGGINRNNNYNIWGSFYNQFYSTENIKANDSSGLISPILTLSSSKYILATVYGSIISYYHKTRQWEFKLDSGRVCAAGMCADAEQNVYIIDDIANIYSIDKSGKLKWKYKITEFGEKDIVTFSDLLAVSDGVIAAATDGTIKKINFVGKVIWEKKFNLVSLKNFPADTDGNLYLPLTNNRYGASDSLISISKTGKLNWSIQFENTRIIKPAVYFKNKIYLCAIEMKYGEKYPKIIIVSSKGKILKEIELSQTPRFISVDVNEIFYAVIYDAGFGNKISTVIAYDSTGTKSWVRNFDVAIPSPLLISEELLAFTGVNHEAYGLYYLNKEGHLLKVLQLTDAPAINLIPTVAPGNAILFGLTDKLGFLRIEETSLNKYLPW